MKLCAVLFSAMLLLSACGADLSRVGDQETPSFTGGGDSINNGDGHFINPSKINWEREAIPKRLRHYYDQPSVTPDGRVESWRHS